MNRSASAVMTVHKVLEIIKEYRVLFHDGL